LNAAGYVHFSIDGIRVYGHRVAVLLVTGAWPDAEVDHIDRNRSNNRWSNLRQAAHSENAHNRAIYRNNSSGLKGIYRNKDRWSASIMAGGKKKHLGTFDTPVLAHLAYCAARDAMHPFYSGDAA
jgi:hypothetical protein